jgi:hypothetical protein
MGRLIFRSPESLTNALATFNQTNQSTKPFIDLGFTVSTEAEDFFFCDDLEAVPFCAGEGVCVDCGEDGL